jgi:hypothetical protein
VRSFFNVKWYQDAKKILEGYQKAEWDAEQLKKERARVDAEKDEGPIREKLKKDLDALNSFAAKNPPCAILAHEPLNRTK